MEVQVKRKYYSLAKYSNLEILMDSQLASAGANQAKILEKYKKNKNAIKHQLLALKFVYGLLFIFIPFFSVWGYLAILGDYSSPIETVILTNSFVFGIFFLMSVLYILMMGLFSTSSFMSGHAFQWLQTLPLSKKELRKLGYVTVFRNLDIALIALVFGFPTILLIMTQDFWLFLMCLASSALNAVFAFSLLIILSEKMSKIFSESSGTSKKANILRIVTMGGFFAIAFGTSFLLSWVLNLIQEFFIVFPTDQSAMLINRILSLIPFPFGITYLIALVAFPGTIPLDLIFTAIPGFILFIILTLVLYQVALKQLKRITTPKGEIEKKKVIPRKEISVEIKTISITKSFIRKDLISSTRNYQNFIFMFMPIIYPVILVLSMTPVITQEVISFEGIIILWSVVLGVNQFIPFMLIAGFLNMEESGASILSSLPILSRKQAKAKLYLMLSIQALGLALLGIVLMLMTQSLILLILFLLTIPIAWIFLIFAFELKVRLFGKMKYKYVIEEVLKQRKVLKWISIIASELLVYFGVTIIVFMLLNIYGVTGIIIGLVVISVIGLSSLLYIFTRMFPKEKELATYYTGGLLRRKVILGALIVMLLFFLFIRYLIIPIELILLPIIIHLEFYQLILVEVIILFIIETLLFFVITPYGLKLPSGKTTLKEYSYSIGFTRTKPLARNIFLGILLYSIFAFSTWIFANILGTYVFDPSVLFGQPTAYPYIWYGWSLFYLMLQPGIWEEVAFRGVILNLQLKKQSKLTAIIINGVLFGVFHLVNIIAGYDPLYVLHQVFFAACLGITLAYIYTKTNSLLPCIIIHYLVDSVNQLFIYAFFPSWINFSLFLIFGFGLIPMILMIGTVYLWFRNKDIR